VGGRKGVPRGRRAGTTGQRKRATLKPLYPNLSGLPESACPLSDTVAYRICLKIQFAKRYRAISYVIHSPVASLTMLIVSTIASSRYPCPRQTVTSVIKTRDNVVTRIA